MLWGELPRDGCAVAVVAAMLLLFVVAVALALALVKKVRAHAAVPRLTDHEHYREGPFEGHSYWPDSLLVSYKKSAVDDH